MASSLLRRTRTLFRHTKKTHKEIARATGIPLIWINQFSIAQSANPGVERVQKLYEYLSGSKLELK